MEKDTDAEIIADLENQIAEGRELEGYEPVPGKTAKKLTVMYAIRLTSDEHREFTQFAEARSVTLADLMRSATRAAVAGEMDVENVAKLSKARAAAEDLVQALRELQVSQTP